VQNVCTPSGQWIWPTPSFGLAQPQLAEHTHVNGPHIPDIGTGNLAGVLGTNRLTIRSASMLAVRIIWHLPFRR
jgi:hypothetical protein